MQRSEQKTVTAKEKAKHGIGLVQRCPFQIPGSPLTRRPGMTRTHLFLVQLRQEIRKGFVIVVFVVGCFGWFRAFWTGIFAIAVAVDFILFIADNAAIVFRHLQKAFAFDFVRGLARLVQVLLSFLAPAMAPLNHKAG
jgi:hypothetical protein